MINLNVFSDETSSGTVNLEPEVQKALAEATDLELTDLAAVLGLYKMLNNQQFYDAQGAGGMVCTESWKDNTLCVGSKFSKNDSFKTDLLWKQINIFTFKYNCNYLIHYIKLQSQSYCQVFEPFPV